MRLESVQFLRYGDLIGSLFSFLREKEKNIELFLFSSLFDSLGICFSVVRIVPL